MPFRAPFACFLGALFAVLVGVSAYQLTHRTPKPANASPDLATTLGLAGDDTEDADRCCYFTALLVARSEERRQITLQVCEGSLSLFDAAAEFRRLNSLPNPSKYDALDLFSGASRNERLCRQVIGWVQVVTYSWPPCQGQAVRKRVEAELREHLECNGRVILPGD